MHEEGEIMQTEQEQDPMMELSKVSMDLTVCLRPLTPPVYEVRIHLVRSAD